MLQFEGHGTHYGCGPWDCFISRHYEFDMSVYVGVWIIIYFFFSFFFFWWDGLLITYLIVLFWHCEGQAFRLHGYFRICIYMKLGLGVLGGPWWCYFCMVMYLHGSHTWSMVLLKHLSCDFTWEEPIHASMKFTWRYIWESF